MVSFFEKITGSISTSKNKQEVPPEPDEGVEIEPQQDTAYEATTVASRSAVKEKKSDEKKDWTSLQSEGQLTVDIFEKDNKIIIQSTIAGVEPDDLDINLTHDMVTIRGSRKHSDEISDDRYYYRELYWGSFSRSIILPEEVDEDKAEASIKNGVLTIKLPKKNKSGQKLKVKSE